MGLCCRRDWRRGSEARADAGGSRSPGDGHDDECDVDRGNRHLGADPVVVDGLDAVGIGQAVANAEPDAIIHEMTALSGTPDFKHFDRWFAQTNRLRTEGTEHLLAAARASNVQRFVTQSFTGWSNARTGGWIKTEDDPLDPHPVKEQTETLAAIKALERAVLEAPLEGIIVRYGGLYGPGSSETLGDILRKRMFPVFGGGAGYVSSTHVDDAAGGTIAALERGGRGIYNIVDDDPARTRDFIPAIADALGAPRPLRSPAWLGRLLAGDVAVTMMTEGRGSSNAKAKRDLDWQPIWPSWRDEFAMATTRRSHCRRGCRDEPEPRRPRRRVTQARTQPDVAEAYVDLRPLLFSNILPDGRERQRGRGHRPGRVHPLPAGTHRRRDHRVAQGLPLGDRHAARDRPPQVGSRPSRDVCRGVAAGAARDRRGRRRPSRARRAGRHAVDVVPRPAAAASAKAGSQTTHPRSPSRRRRRRVPPPCRRRWRRRPP